MPRRELLQLAHTYKPDKHKIAGWYISEKLDGTRCFWDGGLTSGLIESTILLLSDFAATPSEDRNEGLEDCIYEGAEYAAGALLRMLERRQQQRCEAVVRQLGDGSGSDDTKLTANASADNNPIPVLLIDLSNFRMAFAWLL